jgi:hypothetical protein
VDYVKSDFRCVEYGVLPALFFPDDLFYLIARAAGLYVESMELYSEFKISE